MAVAGGFFNRNYAHPVQKQHEKPSFINAGNDFLFGIAISLTDSFKDSIPRGNEEALKKILNYFYHFFPKYINTQPGLAATERISVLFNNPRKSELVTCLSYVLRQLTVDELYAHPLKYREVFSGLNSTTLKNYLRDPNTLLPASALNALAHALRMTITLSYKEPGKELRKRDILCKTDQNEPNLTLQVQNGHYFSVVKYKTVLAYLTQLISNLKPVEINKNTETLDDILRLISQDNSQLLQSYDQWRKTILSMVAAEELTCEQLIELYITFLPKQSTNTLSLSDLEKKERQPVIAGNPSKQQQQIIELLANALASWISTKQIQPDKLFDQIENQTTLSFSK